MCKLLWEIRFKYIFLSSLFNSLVENNDAWRNEDYHSLEGWMKRRRKQKNEAKLLINYKVGPAVVIFVSGQHGCNADPPKDALPGP